MYALVVLLLVAAALVVASRNREHLAVVPNKIVAGTSEEESLRTFAMAPSQLKTSFTAFVEGPSGGSMEYPSWANTPQKKAAFIVRKQVDLFMTGKYIPATAPITDADISSFVQSQISALRTSNPPPPPVFLTNYENGAMTTLLKAYFIDQSSASDTTPQPPVRPPQDLPSTPGNFGQAIEIFRTNYIQYKTTGLSTYKQAYESAEQWINRYLASVESQLTRSNANLTGFVNDYQNANPEMTILQKQMKKITTEGPRAQDEYETVKRVMESNTEVPGEKWNYYVKGAIVVGILGMAAILSAR